MYRIGNRKENSKDYIIQVESYITIVGNTENDVLGKKATQVLLGQISGNGKGSHKTYIIGGNVTNATR